MLMSNRFKQMMTWRAILVTSKATQESWCNRSHKMNTMIQRLLSITWMLVGSNKAFNCLSRYTWGRTITHKLIQTFQQKDKQPFHHRSTDLEEDLNQPLKTQQVPPRYPRCLATLLHSPSPSSSPPRLEQVPICNLSRLPNLHQKYQGQLSAPRITYNRATSTKTRRTSKSAPRHCWA